MNLKEMGVSLRHERERQGLTIDDVVDRTKISKSNILAMEEGDLEMLPHPVYAKGFARNYAKLLGLDPEVYADAMGREFTADDNIAESAAVNSADLEASHSTVDEEAPGRSGGKVMFAGLFLLALCIGGVIFFFRTSQAPVAEVAAPELAVEEPAVAPTAESEPQAQVVLEEPVAQQADDVEPLAVASKNEESVTVAEPTPVEQTLAAVEVETQEPAAVEIDTQTPVAAVVNTRQRVVITADEVCWVFAAVDGGEDSEDGAVVDVTLQPGQSKILDFDEEMRVKLGNAGGVHLTFNGKDYPFEAQSGQVKTLEFKAQ